MDICKVMVRMLLTVRNFAVALPASLISAKTMMMMISAPKLLSTFIAGLELSFWYVSLNEDIVPIPFCVQSRTNLYARFAIYFRRSS